MRIAITDLEQVINNRKQKADTHLNHEQLPRLCRPGPPLVELGLDVNGKAGGESPLWCAARGGHLDTVKLLVELGADVHARNPFYDSPPLGSAKYKGHRHVVEYLLQFAPISDAVKYGGLDRLRALLLENPDCVHFRDEAGRTPLHYPYRDTPHGGAIIELLIAHGADASAKDNEGRTPADQMLRNGRRDLADVLRRYGGDSVPTQLRRVARASADSEIHRKLALVQSALGLDRSDHP